MRVYTKYCQNNLHYRQEYHRLHRYRFLLPPPPPPPVVDEELPPPPPVVDEELSELNELLKLDDSKLAALDELDSELDEEDSAEEELDEEDDELDDELTDEQFEQVIVILSVAEYPTLPSEQLFLQVMV